MADINKLYLIAIIILAGCSQQDPEDIAQRSLIIDTHIDTPYRIKSQLDNYGEYENIALNTNFDFDYPSAMSGGLNVPFFSIYLPAQTEEEGTSFQLANELIDLMNSIIEMNADKFFFVDTSVYLGNLPGQNLIGVAYGMENGAALEGDLSNVSYFYKRGVRYITLTHAKSNNIADSS